MFWPDPIPEIDEQLIDNNLVWLSDFPAAKKDIQDALGNKRLIWILNYDPGQWTT